MLIVELTFRILSTIPTYSYKVEDGIVSWGSKEIAAKNWDGGRIYLELLFSNVVAKPLSISQKN